MTNSKTNARRFVSTVACAFIAFGMSAETKANFIGISTDTGGEIELVGNGDGTLNETNGIDTCAFDGTNTVCTVSGTYVDGPSSTIASTGSFIYTMTYPGNGPSPFLVESSGTTRTAIGLGNGSYLLELMPDNAPDQSFLAELGQFANGFFFAGATAMCTGLAPATACSIGEVGMVSGATVRAPYQTFDFFVPAELFAIPLPATAWLFLTGGLAMGGVARRWSRKRV